VYAHSALQDSRAYAGELLEELERERRLAGQPVLASPKGYRAAESRTSRGTL